MSSKNGLIKNTVARKTERTCGGRRWSRRVLVSRGFFRFHFFPGYRNFGVPVAGQPSRRRRGTRALGSGGVSCPFAKGRRGSRARLDRKTPRSVSSGRQSPREIQRELYARSVRFSPSGPAGLRDLPRARIDFHFIVRSWSVVNA